MKKVAVSKKRAKRTSGTVKLSSVAGSGSVSARKVRVGGAVKVAGKSYSGVKGKASKAPKKSSTFDKWMKSRNIKEAYEDEFQEFVLSELIRALMEDDGESVRGLAKKVGLSPTVIQDIRSGKQKDMKITNFISIINACGFKMMLIKGKKSMQLDDCLSLQKS